MMAEEFHHHSDVEEQELISNNNNNNNNNPICKAPECKKTSVALNAISSGDEIANVNFLRRYGTYVLQNTKKNLLRLTN